MRILIVEDHPDAGDSLALMLRLSGYEAQVTRDGDAAARAVQGAPPDVLILDLGLPREDGYRVAQRLLLLLAHRPLLIALTGYGQAEDVERCRQEGFDHHFLKPADPDLLRRVLEAYGARPARAGGTDPGAPPSAPPGTGG